MTAYPDIPLDTQKPHVAVTLGDGIAFHYRDGHGPTLKPWQRRLVKAHLKAALDVLEGTDK